MFSGKRGGLLDRTTLLSFVAPPPHVGLDMEVCLSGHQRIDHIKMSIMTGPHEGRVSILCAGTAREKIDVKATKKGCECQYMEEPKKAPSSREKREIE